MKIGSPHLIDFDELVDRVSDVELIPADASVPKEQPGQSPRVSLQHVDFAAEEAGTDTTETSPTAPGQNQPGQNQSESEGETCALSMGSRDAIPDMSKVYDIYWVEAQRTAIMVVAFAIALAHLYVYELLVDTKVAPKDSIPIEEIYFFHHGWTAMLTIFLVEAFSVGLKIWCTWHKPVLAVAVAQKLEGSIGVLFGEYIVVGATYVIMAWNLMPVFLEERTNRRVYGVRYMEWTVDACGLVWLDCYILFSQPFKKFYMAFVWSVAYMIFGLWSAISPTWLLYWVFLMASWGTFFIVCWMLIRFLQRDPKPDQPFKQGVKPGILAFIITWWILYGVLFMVAFWEYCPQWVEQFLWTGMDVVMKLSHTVVLMAWRGSQWDIDAVVKRQNAEAARFVTQLDKQRAITDRDRLRLLAKIHTRSELTSVDEGYEAFRDGEGGDERQITGVSMADSTKANVDENAIADDLVTNDVAACILEIWTIYKEEAFKTLVLCVAFLLAVLHLYIYPELFNVKVLPPEDVPDDELRVFHHGWTAMLVVFLIEAITILLKVSATWHQPTVAMSQARKLYGNIGVLFGEYLVVGATYIIMGYNIMPVFIELRTGRRVYAVRYMEWLVDACGLISLDCHCLFNRSFQECRWTFVWTILYMLFGLWSAISSTWLWYWIFLLLSWLTFFFTCANLVKYLWNDPYPADPFNNSLVKPAILTFIISWWILYGVLFMVAFQAPEIMPQWVEQLLWTGMDVVMKLSHTIVLIGWRELQSDMNTMARRRKAIRDQKVDKKEIKQLRREGSQLFKDTKPGMNWTSTPGLAMGVPEMVRLQAECGAKMLSDMALKSMMNPDEFAEMQRLDKVGFSYDQLQQKYDGQNREQTFLRRGMNHTSYNPQYWAQTLIGLHGRVGVPYPCWIIITVALAVALLNAYEPESLEHFMISDRIHALLGGSIMFLVVFRTQYAFRKWWDGRCAFGDIVLYSRMVAQQSCAYILDDDVCRKIVKYVITTVVATRCHLRLEKIDPQMLAGILGDAEIEDVNKKDNMPFYATWVVRTSFASAVTNGQCLPFHMALDNAVRALELAISNAERLLTPMPFIYVAHLRSFLFSYLLFLPFVLVTELGGLMVFAVAAASYLLFGLENTAVTMENPFGYEDNDLPLDLYCIEVTRDLLCLLELRCKAQRADEERSDPSVASGPMLHFRHSTSGEKRAAEEKRRPNFDPATMMDHGHDDDGGGDD